MEFLGATLFILFTFPLIVMSCVFYVYVLISIDMLSETQQHPSKNLK